MTRVAHSQQGRGLRSPWPPDIHGFAQTWLFMDKASKTFRAVEVSEMVFWLFSAMDVDSSCGEVTNDCVALASYLMRLDLRMLSPSEWIGAWAQPHWDI